MTGFSISSMMDTLFIDATFSTFREMITCLPTTFNDSYVSSLIFLIYYFKNRTTYFLTTLPTIISSNFYKVNRDFLIILMWYMYAHICMIIGIYGLSKLVFLFFSLYSLYSFICPKNAIQKSLPDRTS